MKIDLEYKKIRVLHLICPECKKLIMFSGDFSKDKIKCNNYFDKHENREFKIIDNIKRISITYDVIKGE